MPIEHFVVPYPLFYAYCFFRAIALLVFIHWMNIPSCQMQLLAHKLTKVILDTYSVLSVNRHCYIHLTKKRKIEIAKLWELNNIFFRNYSKMMLLNDSFFPCNFIFIIVIFSFPEFLHIFFNFALICFV